MDAGSNNAIGGITALCFVGRTRKILDNLVMMVGIGAFVVLDYVGQRSFVLEKKCQMIQICGR